jgi:flagellar hook-associated protein 3 FlgL
MLNTQLLRNLNSNLNRMDNLQNQLATGRKINKPSDDPVGISFSMRYRSELSANDQYKKNVDATTSWLEYSDTMLDQAGTVLQRARELAVSGANGTNSEESYKAFKNEVDQLYSQMISIGNSQFNGKYVFNGQITDQKPYPDDADAMNATPEQGEIRFEIGLGVRISANVTGTQVFGEAGDETNIYQVLKTLSEGLDEQDSEKVSSALGLLDERMSKFLSVRADVGAKINRIELAQNRLEDIDLNVQSLKSKIEDADMAEVITNLKMDENVYQASLSAGTKLIMPSLMDYLR